MTDISPAFDGLSAQLDDFVRVNGEEIARVDAELEERALAPLSVEMGKALSRDEGVAVMLRLSESAEARFAAIAARLDIDPWLSLVRRFPAQPHWPDGWETYLTLGVLRHAAAEAPPTLPRVRNGGHFGVVLSLTHDDFLDAFRLAALSRILAQVAGVFRCIQKGGQLEPLHDNLLRVVVSPDLAVAISHYERRRPKTAILQDEGFFVPIEEAGRGDLLVLSNANRHLRVRVPGPELFLLSRHVPFAVRAGSVFRVLRSYEDAIEDLFKTSVDAICHVLAVVTARTLQSIPRFTGASGDVLEVERHDGSLEYQQRLGFMFGLCQRGYLRFPRSHWLERVGEIESPWGGDERDRRDLVESFFAAFTLPRSERAKVDLSLLRPIPFVFESGSGEVYADFTATLDFIAWILERAKEWFSSQHGDRFTLALKRAIEERRSARVLGWKLPFPGAGAGGEGVEADLAVVQGEVLYVIECKAFAKSREYFRGDYRAFDGRRRRIRKGVEQARRAATAVAEAISAGRLTVPGVRRTEWVLCTPTQEFLCPLDEFGLLDADVPRVCTPEELLKVLDGPGRG